jgi:drug/metabolite transporter (DMT)-like permease
VSPVLWGLTGAFGFGISDFIARLTSRAIGPTNSLLGTLIFGFIGLGVVAAFWEQIFIWQVEGLIAVIASGVGLMVAPLLFYAALNRGPVSVAAPVGSSFPAFIVVGMVALGIYPTGLQWSAMAGTMIGVLVVARTGREATQAGAPAGQGVLPTVLLSLGASIGVAASLLVAREASAAYGEFQSVWLIRSVSLLTLLLFMAGTRRLVRLPIQWWPALVLQGLLEIGGFVALLIGLAGTGAALAAVASAPFAVVTVLLARFFLKEGVPARQWGGILIVVVSVAVLAYVG